MGKAISGFEGIWKGDEAGWGVRGFHPVSSNSPLPPSLRPVLTVPPPSTQIVSQSPHLPHLLPDSWISSLENSLPRLPRALVTSSQTSDDSDGSDEEEEEDAFASFTALVKGPKRSGKSTFARALVNGLLDRYRYVAVLEADLGQGEWGVEGSVSLVVVERPILGPFWLFLAIVTGSSKAVLSELVSDSERVVFSFHFQALLSLIPQSHSALTTSVPHLLAPTPPPTSPLSPTSSRPTASTFSTPRPRSLLQTTATPP